MKHCCSLSLWRGVRKLSALLACVLFTFVFVVSPLKVNAAAFPLPPLWLPMNPYNAQGLHDNFVLLNDDQKEIVKEVIGAVNIVNLGFGQYVLTNPTIGIPATRDFLREYGDTFLNTFWSQIMGSPRAMTDFVGSVIYKASTYDNLVEYESETSPDVDSGSHKYFQISPELTVAFKTWYRVNGGVEDWQNQVKPFKSDVAWKKYTSASDVILNQLDQYYNTYNTTIRANSIYSTQYNLKLTSETLLSYHYIFVNTSQNIISLVNSSGERFLNTFEANWAYIFNNGSTIRADYSTRNMGIGFSEYNPNSYSNYVDIVRDFYNFNLPLSANLSSDPKIFYEDFVDHVYVGADWASRHEIFNIDDLNIGSSPSEYIDNISDIGYVDINTLIEQIADEVVNLRDVVEESVLVKDGDTAIPYADSLLVAIDKYINQPESGVVISADIFSGLTGAGGPVSYLWFMTKPLVSYTGDLLGLLTLDGDGTFQFTGLGYIVVGVVTVGIIGGIITKCLL